VASGGTVCSLRIAVTDGSTLGGLRAAAGRVLWAGAAGSPLLWVHAFVFPLWPLPIGSGLGCWLR
jgi:hypothetical protein